MAAKPRDLLDQAVDVLGRTSGRDKFCRSTQYASKFMLGYLAFRAERGGAAAQPSAQLVETLTKVGSSMSMCRKVLRFGRTAEFYRAIASSPVPGDAVSALRLLSKACLLSYFCFDHVVYFQAVGVVRLRKETAARAARFTNFSWLGNVSCDLLTGLHDLAAVGARLRRLPKGATPAQRAALDAERVRLTRAVIRNALDFGLALDATNFIDIKPVVSGFVGLVTSLMGLYEVALSV